MRKHVAEKHVDFCLDDSWRNPVLFSAPSYFNCSLGRTAENELILELIFELVDNFKLEHWHGPLTFLSLPTKIVHFSGPGAMHIAHGTSSCLW